MNKIMVTIVCITYNHENYIKDALNSFLEQITNFEFEIIVHDDVSTDGTRQILKEYETLYPDKIKVVYQSENQYSKGVPIMGTFLFPEARGKYIAICEGDDYWIDTNKLQKQVDYMESHNDCSICIHNAMKVNRDKKNMGVISTVKSSCEIPCEKFILSGGGFCATNSILTKAEFARQFHETGLYEVDYALQIFLAGKGNAYCFSEVMSAYRANVEGSWSRRSKENVQYGVECEKKIIRMLRKYNELSNFTYETSIKACIVKHELVIKFKLEDYKGILNDKKIIDYIKSMPLLKRTLYFMRIKLGCSLPRFTRFIIKSMKKFRKIKIKLGID